MAFCQDPAPLDCDAERRGFVMMGRTDTTVLPTFPGRLGSGLVYNVFKSLVELFHLFSFEQRGTGTPSSVFR